MKEQVTTGPAGNILEVYPTLKDDDPDTWMAVAGRVEALPYWTESGYGEKTYGVKVGIAFREPMTRAQSDSLTAALARCWQWIDQQQEQTARALLGEGGRT